MTAAGTRKLQHEAGLKVDEQAGKNTYAALETKLHESKQSAPTKQKPKVGNPISMTQIVATDINRLQIGLRRLGFKVHANGELDRRTINSYIEWQNGGGMFDNRGRKGIITQSQIVKIEKQSQAKIVYSASFRNPTKIVTYFARTTAYHKEENTTRLITKTLKNGKKKKVRIDLDPWTKRGLTSTGAPLLYATKHQAGTIGVDPCIISYGSAIMVPTHNDPEFYIGGDTGGAVINRRAARRSGKTAKERRAIVVDCFRKREPMKYAYIKVAPYKGRIPFQQLSKEEKLKHFDINFVKAQFASIKG